MSQTEAKLQPEAAEARADGSWAPDAAPSAAGKRHWRVLPYFITLVTVAMAVVLGQAMWNAYMGAPWTRDGAVRAYVVTMAPEVAGRIVELPEPLGA